MCYWVDALSDELHIPTSLKAIGLDASSTRDLGAKAEANPTGWTNPIRFTAEEYERIYMKALAGHERSRFYEWSARESKSTGARTDESGPPPSVSARSKL